MRGAYTRAKLLTPFVVEGGVGLTKDVIAAMFNSHSVEIPLRALIPRLGVDMDPDF